MERRTFLRAVAAGASGAAAVGWPEKSGAARIAGATAEPLRIREPFHGAVLNRRTGKEVDGGLEIAVRGEAPLRDRVMVNGAPAARDGAGFSAPLVLRERETEVVAVSEGSSGRREHRVRVVWDRRSFPRYRFSLDDNSFFLRTSPRRSTRRSSTAST